MDILLAPVPLFSAQMAVEAYYFRYQKSNIITLSAVAAGQLDGAMNSPLLESLKLVGSEPFAMEKPVFVPVSAMMLLGSLSRQCPAPYERIVFLLSDDVMPTEQYLSRIRSLKQLGFHFAMRDVENITSHEPVFAECEYLFQDQSAPMSKVVPTKLPPALRHLKLVATNIDTMDSMKKLSSARFSLFEGPFYRLPITMGKSEVAPLKVNLVRLLNTVRDKSFEFSDIASIIERDTALSISLMQLVNSPYLGLSGSIKTIGHAVSMLGESEVRKWATTSVSRLLGSDKPDEITRLSLIRAKFAENLASVMNMGRDKQSLFMTGLFSVLDVVLDMSMAEALKNVHVDDKISRALVGAEGPFYPVLHFILSYERADWKEVSRQLILNDIRVESIYDSYINAVLWYKSLIEESEAIIDKESQTTV